MSSGIMGRTVERRPTAVPCLKIEPLPLYLLLLLEPPARVKDRRAIAKRIAGFGIQPRRLCRGLSKRLPVRYVCSAFGTRRNADNSAHRGRNVIMGRSNLRMRYALAISGRHATLKRSQLRAQRRVVQQTNLTSEQQRQRSQIIFRRVALARNKFDAVSAPFVSVKPIAYLSP